MHLPYSTSLGRVARFTTLCSAPLLAGAPAFAQTTLSGALSDSTTGPLNAGVYVTAGSLSVPAGQTLTIQPGVIIKFSFNSSFTVGGRLLVNGTGPNSVVFTEVRDDSVGGDTNGDGGASSPGPGYWNSLRLLSTSGASVIEGLTVRYSGRGSRSVLLSNSSASLTDCAIVDSSTASFDLENNSRPTLVRCSSIRSGGEAFTRVPLAALPGFSGLGASGGTSDFINVSSPTLAPGDNVVIAPSNLINGTAVLSSSLTVPETSTLRVQAGTVMKWAFASRCNVDGELRLVGTAAAPVIFTEVRDDSAGGDTNGDGSVSVPSPGYWGGVLLRDTADASLLSHAEIRYAGRNGAGLELVSSTATVNSCELFESSSLGLDLNANSRPSISGLNVVGAGSSAVGAASIQALAGITGLNLTGNAFDRIDVTSATVVAGESVAFGPENGAAGAFHFIASMIVEPGAQLDIAPGAICKMGFATRCQIDGVLTADASSAAPVIFTEVRDDSVGGDTNGDGGASDPTPAYWAGLLFSDAADSSLLANVEVRYAGRNGAGIKVSNAAMAMERCRVKDCFGLGIDLDESTEPCLLDRPRIDRCSGAAAIGNVRLDRIEDILRPSGEGNARNTIQVTEGTLSADTSVEIQHLWDGAVSVADSILVPDGVSLTLGPNIAIKMGFATRMDIEGALSVRGSFEQAAILTEIRDDSAGGDTNGDAGASVPSRGYWTGLTLRSTTATSIVQGLEVRFAGRSGAAVESATDRAVLREVRVTESSSDGFRISDSPVALERLVAAGCAGDGLELLSGGFDVRQVTLLGPGGFGVRALPAYSGSVKDSIVRGHTSGASTGLSPARFTYSSVDSNPGTGGITTDPLFVDAASGDYRLTSTSPCINAGDPTSNPDPDSTRADMGAYFRNACEPAVICAQSLAFPPCLPVMGYEGFASVSSVQPFLVTLDDAPTNSFGSFFYSMGAQTTITALYGDLCVGGPYQRTPAVASGGNPADGPCVGRFALDFNAFLQSGADQALTPGSSLIGHFWYRYGAAFGNARFSDGIRIVICP